ncbi:MAG: hypothetical protein Q9225_002343 [Loekoesia sp. 1 TL-2023]
MAATTNGSNIPIPVLLLKNPSSGHEDPYTTHLSSNPPTPISKYQPIYVPVLEHTLYTDPILTILDRSLKGGDTELPVTTFAYGGLIFTSQRAVEAFASALAHLSSLLDADPKSLILRRLEHLAIPLYAVGPATALSLDGIVQEYLPRCWIRGGEDAGTGEALAELILTDYNSFYSERTDVKTAEGRNDKKKKPLLFLTSAKHRDIIPVTLTSAPPEQRIDVEELIVYASTESQSFAFDISNALTTTATASIRWIVIFSPMAGETLLRTLGWPDDESMTIHNPAHPCWVDRKTFIVSIGPTTRDYMMKKFGFNVDVCAEKPSPEGVRKGIEECLRKNGLVP